MLVFALSGRHTAVQRNAPGRHELHLCLSSQYTTLLETRGENVSKLEKT